MADSKVLAFTYRVWRKPQKPSEGSWCTGL